MQKHIKRIGLFFLSALLLCFKPNPVLAQVTSLSCSGFQVTALPTLSNPYLDVQVADSVISDSDPALYTIIYQSESFQRQSGEFSSSMLPYTFRFESNIAELTQNPVNLYLISELGETQYCRFIVTVDEESGEVSADSGELPLVNYDLCQQAGTSRSTCDTCLANGEIWTGMGCIPYSAEDQAVRTLLTIGLGITGGVVVLMTLYASFLLSTSQGDPKRVDEAKGAVTSAIVGALFIIFSVTILRFIGVEVLKLPAFG